MQHYKNVSALKNPQDLLYQIGARVSAAIQSREQGVAVQHSWNGIGFSLCGQKMVAELGQIVEILPLPEYTTVHGSEPWLLGVTNVRGALVTLVDLECFCGSAPQKAKPNSRVLLIQDGYSRIGLVVKKVFGLKNFHVDHFQTLDSSAADDLMPYLDAAPYLDAEISAATAAGKDAEKWLRFSITKLLANGQLV